VHYTEIVLSESIAKKYADSLQGRDIRELFEELERIHGSISKAAKACALERKTIYDWKRQAVSDNLRTRTKRKVVSALLEQLPEHTMRFMIDRMISRTRELLDIYLSTIYENAMRERTPAEFLRIAQEFGKSNVKYGGLLAGSREVETSGMIDQLWHRAEEFGVKLDVPPRRVYGSFELERRLPEALALACRVDRPSEVPELASRLGLSPSIVQIITKSLRELPLSVAYPIASTRQETVEAVPLTWKRADLRNLTGEIEIPSR
jgi:hypothetical protein